MGLQHADSADELVNTLRVAVARGSLGEGEVAEALQLLDGVLTTTCHRTY